LPSQKNQQTTTTATVATQTGRKGLVENYGQYAINGILIFIVVMLFLIIVRRMMRFFYDVFNARRIIYLKVMLPRGQSKLDLEQEKELAKDMKEKI